MNHRLTSMMTGAVLIAACSGSPAATGDSACKSNFDCPEGQSCVDEKCGRSNPGPAPGKPDASPPPDGKDAGSPSTCSNVTCNGACCDAGEVCQNNVCTRPSPSCRAPGSSCSSQTDCCQSGTGVGSMGAECISDTGLCHAKCTANAQCSSGCCAGVQGQSYGVCASSSYCQQKKGIGAACTASSECESGRCNGSWCTESCSASNSICAGGHGSGGLYNQYGELNWCMSTQGGTMSCFPGCTTGSDCVYYPGTSCKYYRDVTGTTVSICSL